MATIPCSASDAVKAHAPVEKAIDIIDRWRSLGHTLACP